MSINKRSIIMKFPLPLYFVVKVPFVSMKPLWCQRIESWKLKAAAFMGHIFVKSKAACLCAILRCVMSAEPWTWRPNNIHTERWWEGDYELSFFFFAWKGCRAATRPTFLLTEPTDCPSPHPPLRWPLKTQEKNPRKATLQIHMLIWWSSKLKTGGCINRSVFLVPLSAWPLLCELRWARWCIAFHSQWLTVESLTWLTPSEALKDALDGRTQSPPPPPV